MAFNEISIFVFVLTIVLTPFFVVLYDLISNKVLAIGKALLASLLVIVCPIIGTLVYFLVVRKLLIANRLNNV